MIYITKEFKKMMKLHGVTFADLGKKIDRSPATVKQRLNSEATFRNHVKLYTQAFNECLKDKEIIKKKARDQVDEIR